jgi:hypothetical protein
MVRLPLCLFRSIRQATSTMLTGYPDSVKSVITQFEQVYSLSYLIQEDMSNCGLC